MLKDREKILVEGALVLDPRAGDAGLRCADVLIDGGIIVQVGRVEKSNDRGARVIAGNGKLLAPGLVNAHTHSPSSVMSGVGDDLSHPVFMWLTQAYTSNRTQDEIYLCAMLNCAQMLLSGTTAAIDHFPGQCFGPEDLETVLKASRDSGMRIALGMRFFDAEFGDIFPRGRELPEGLKDQIRRVGPLKPQPLAGLRELMEGTIRGWHGADERLAVFPAPSNPERCSDAALILCAELAEKYDTGIHTHLLETQVQAELAQEKHGCTIIEHLHRLGVFSHRWSCAHSIWLTDEDIDRMSEAGAVAVHNPESNLKLGTGIAPVPKLVKRGVTVALGTDGSSANDNLLMHEVMRLAAVIHRPFEPKRSEWISSRDVWRMATLGGAAAMLNSGVVGEISVGQRADLVLYNLDEFWWRPLNNPISQMVFAETGKSVDTVLVDGRIVVEAGKITAFDADSMLREIEPMMQKIRTKNAEIFEVTDRIAQLFE